MLRVPRACAPLGSVIDSGEPIPRDTVTNLMAAGGRIILAALVLARPLSGQRPVKLEDGWPVAAPSEVGMSAAVLGRIDSLAAAGRLGILDAVVIVKDGKLVYER